MGSPAAADMDPFAFLYETYLAGGPGALSGETSQATIYLEPGTYAVVAFGFGAAVELTVTGTADPAAPGRSRPMRRSPRRAPAAPSTSPARCRKAKASSRSTTIATSRTSSRRFTRRTRSPRTR